MAIEPHTSFLVRCDKCTCPLFATSYLATTSHSPITHFPTVLSALHRALNQGWTTTPSLVLCPTCSQPPKTEPTT